ncbi:MAG TPA: RraA family protein [Caulobacteraceae bacterium]
MGHEKLIYRDIVRIDPALLDAIRGMSVADICDTLPAPISASALMHRSIRAITPGLRSCGQAITAFAANGDGLIPHVALYVAQAGDVLVLSNGPQESDSALCGGNAALDAKAKGVAGAVCDGAVRDVAALREMGFPTWGKAVTGAHGGKEGVGWVNKAVSCGGVIVKPGDIVVADDDGVIAFSPAYAEFVVKEVGRLQQRDAMVKARIANGERLFEMANFGEKVEIQDGVWRLDPTERA